MQAHPTGGFTLIEVLVALFVLAVGVAGTGAAQLAAQRTRQQSALMSEAVQLAASLAARMRVNADLAALPAGSNPYLALDYDAVSEGDPGPPPASCYGASQCNPLRLAAFDLHEAKRAVFASFPGGRVALCRDRAPWDSAANRHRWTCTAGADAPLVIKLGWIGTGDAPGLVAVVPL